MLDLNHLHLAVVVVVFIL